MLRLPGQADLLTQLIDVAELRHRVISHNIANVNTPGYHRLDVSFEEHLTRSATEAVGSSGRAEPVVQEEAGLPERADGNNVDIDREIGQLNKNALLYQTYTQLVATHLQAMRRAIEG